MKRLLRILIPPIVIEPDIVTNPEECKRYDSIEGDETDPNFRVHEKTMMEIDHFLGG